MSRPEWFCGFSFRSLSLLLVLAACGVVEGYDPSARMNFDGTRADMAVFRAGCARSIAGTASLNAPCPNYSPGSQFLYQDTQSTQPTVFSFGYSMDFPVPADFTGDQKTDYAVFRWFEPNGFNNNTNSWFVWLPNSGSLSATGFGLVTDQFVPRNYSSESNSFRDPMPGQSPTPNPDGAETGVFRRQRSTNWTPELPRYDYGFWIQRGVTRYIPTAYGTALTQYPVPQDYLDTAGDPGADGISEPAVVEMRANESCYRLWKWETGSQQYPTELPQAVCLSKFKWPTPGDYDGDGTADFAGAWVKGSDLKWIVRFNRRNSDLPLPDLSKTFGDENSLPVPADYDGDGKTDFAYVRPSSLSDPSLVWTIEQSKNGVVVTKTFGTRTDTILNKPYFSDPWYFTDLWYFPAQ